MFRLAMIGCFLACLFASTGYTQDNDAKEEKAAAVDEETARRFKAFEERMNGVKLVGRFTIVGRDNPPPKEEYIIESVKKLPEGDYWQVNARIKYGDKNTPTLPLKLEIKWAGDTPMISLTDFTIPGLGTFSSRVIFYNKKYAGTWTHGRVGGHMFGSIEKLKPADSE